MRRKSVQKHSGLPQPVLMARRLSSRPRQMLSAFRTRAAAMTMFPRRPDARIPRVNCSIWCEQGDISLLDILHRGEDPDAAARCQSTKIRQHIRAGGIKEHARRRGCHHSFRCRACRMSPVVDQIVRSPPRSVKIRAWPISTLLFAKIEISPPYSGNDPRRDLWVARDRGS